ncbi:MAG: type II and III secretion system protein [Kiritimatiellae bacterium]|nr:type II and III secretion system protein [Kiritimatiellia bacterium]
MREIRAMVGGVLCAVIVVAAHAQQGAREGRRGSARAPREAGAGNRASAALTGAISAEQSPDGAPVRVAGERPSAESADYTRLLEQFLKSDEEQLEVVFYRCRYISAETMRRLLENFLTPAGTVGRSDEDDIVVVSDVPSRLPQLKQILEQADHPVAQVLVEARIVELEISDDLVRDIHMGVAKMGESDSVRKIFQDLLIPNSAGAGVEDLTRTFSAGKGSDGRLWSFAGFDQVKIWAMINFLQERGRARILSSPNLVIRRGADGNIMTGEKVPVLSRTITGSSESISTRFENVGVKLIVRPLMISGTRIHVKVNPEVSSSSRTVDTGGFETPVIVVRSASTELEANDGELITIGGLMRQEQRETEKRIPYLADIPYLGVLFQYKKTKAFTSQIVIFMTMRLVEPGAFDRLGDTQAAGVTEDLRARIQAIEEEVARDNQAIWDEMKK